MADRPTAAISRRSIVKGLAWTMPAVAVAVAAPAHAVMSPCCTDVTVTANTDDTCKSGGNYNAVLTIENKCSTSPTRVIVNKVVHKTGTTTINNFKDVDGGKPEDHIVSFSTGNGDPGPIVYFTICGGVEQTVQFPAQTGNYPKSC